MEALPIQMRPDDREVPHELAEDEGLVPIVQELRDCLEETLQLGSRDVRARHDELRMAAGPAEPGDLRQDLHVAAPGLVVPGFERLHRT